MRSFHIHSIVGRMWDGAPLVAAISEHEARLAGNTVISSGEVRNAHVKVTRRYTFLPETIDCEVELAESDYARVLSIWSHDRLWSEVQEAYEMIPFIVAPKKSRPVTVTLRDAAGRDLGPATAAAIEAQTVRIDRGGSGVEIRLGRPLPVQLGENHTVLLGVVVEGPKPRPAADVKLKYRLVPY